MPWPLCGQYCVLQKKTFHWLMKKNIISNFIDIKLKMFSWLKHKQSQYNHCLSTLVRVWRRPPWTIRGVCVVGVTLGKSREECPSYSLKTPDLHMLCTAGRKSATKLTLSPNRELRPSHLWKSKLEYWTIVSPPIFPNPDSFVSRNSTKSPWWLQS